MTAVDRGRSDLTEPGPGRAVAVFSDVLAPLNVGPFLERWFAREPIVLVGHPARFDHLLSLAQVEQLVLRHHRDRAGADAAGRPRDRIELSDSFGTTIRPDLFHRPLDLPGGALASLDVEWVGKAIEGGARVTVHAVDELDQVLAGLTTTAAEGVGRAASMQAVANWAPASLPPRVSTSHLLILQILGSRRWSVAGPESDATEAYQLDRGQALYVPAARTVSFDDCETPALNLIILLAAQPPKLVVDDLLAKLARLEVFREDLPLPSAPEACAAQANRLRTTLDALLAAAGAGGAAAT
jgi:hypothetical protein